MHDRHLNYCMPAVQGLTEAAVIGIAYPVLQVLSFMHQLSLMHRDVKVRATPGALASARLMSQPIVACQHAVQQHTPHAAAEVPE